jgi:hypothetical protein
MAEGEEKEKKSLFFSLFFSCFSFSLGMSCLAILGCGRGLRSAWLISEG